MITQQFTFIVLQENYSKDKLKDFNQRVQKRTKRWQTEDPFFITNFIAIEKDHETITLVANMMYNKTNTGLKRQRSIERLFSEIFDNDGTKN